MQCRESVGRHHCLQAWEQTFAGLGHQPGSGSQSLVFKLDRGNAVSLEMNSSFATLHINGFSWLSLWIGVYQLHQVRDRFLMPYTVFLHLAFSEVQRRRRYIQ
jgi:hypothetical protein